MTLERYSIMMLLRLHGIGDGYGILLNCRLCLQLHVGIGRRRSFLQCLPGRQARSLSGRFAC